jgi:SAM-dependent methyltransferase
MTPPVPPQKLLARIGEESAEGYVAAGRAIRSEVEGLLGGGWTWESKRVLDFGCGSGRLLGRFSPEELSRGEFVGVDIDEPSVAWVNANLGPEVVARTIGEEPPLPFDGASFDLVVASSVVTHLTDLWAEWMVELHRVLAPDGLMIVSFFSDAYAPVLLPDVEWDPDRVGMLALGYGAPWSAGGPMVLFSEWWIRAHWGRLFDIEHLRTSGFAAAADVPSQGVVVLRRKEVELTPDDLRAPEPDEPRELAALETALAQTQRERADLNRGHDAYADAYEAARRELEALKRRPLARLDSRLRRRIGR